MEVHYQIYAQQLFPNLNFQIELRTENKTSCNFLFHFQNNNWIILPVQSVTRKGHLFFNLKLN